jgi:intracellular sulfur oxidation DsrE/DsrF family protein
MPQLIFMKHILLIAAFLFAAGCQLFSQTKPYHVVFDITTGDTATHQRVIRWIKGILETHPDAKVEVVFYGKSLNMVEAEKSSVAGDVKNLAAVKNVTFAVCEQAMKAHKVDKSMLVPGVSTVPDAIYELISKQADGYGYIKVVN